MLTFKNGMPSLGLGLWKIPNALTASTVIEALNIGYRHLDSACDYGNEAQVGEGVQQALKQGICKRQDIWITSKLWNTYHRPEHVKPALERTLSDLKTDYLDLFMMHFPISLRYVPIETRYPPEWIYDPSSADPKMIIDPVPLADTWAAMESLVDEGLIRQIGVCNFSTGLINDLLAYARIKPSVVQVESHPLLSQIPLIRRCQEADIVVTAFSPLGASSYVELGMANTWDSLLSHPLMKDLAEKYDRTPAQILIRWGIQRQTAVICKSVQPHRLAENFAAFDFELSSHSMQAVNSLNQNHRYNDPGVFCEKAFGLYYPIYD